MIAFDTNILVYSCAESDPRRQAIALSVLHDATQGVLLWQVACEFIAVSRKLVAKGFTYSHAWQRLAELMDLFPLVTPSIAVLDHARRLHIEQQWSFWDAMIVGACLEAGVTRLYSEDLPGRQPPQPLEWINPFA